MMNGRVNTFFEKLKKGRGGVKSGASQAPDCVPSLHQNGRATEMKTIDTPVDLGDGVDDHMSSGKGCMLAYTMDHLLKDSMALSYFINFLDSCDKINLIKFWMHVEGLRSSACTSTADSNNAAQSLCFLDAKNIFDKYVDEESPCTIALPKKIYKKIQGVVSAPCVRVQLTAGWRRLSLVKAKMDPQHFTIDVFEEAQSFVKQLFELRYFQEFLNSVYYKKHELDVLSKRTCLVLDIVHIEQLLLSFMEMTEERNERHYVEMLLAVDTWERQYDESGDAELLEDAMAIYDRFFSMQASRGRVSVSDSTRVALEGRICTESGRPHRRAFLPVKQWAINYLTENYLSDFLDSAPFLSYLSELVQTIEFTVELPRASRRDRRREGSVGASSSGADSLPVILNRHFENLDNRPSCSSSISDMTGESTSSRGHSTPTATPSTPQTPRSARLAEVDSMGRYTPLYDTTFTAEANAPSKLKTRFRKYWDKSTLREEEIAEEVAKTIIADIQTMVDNAGRA